MKGPLLGAQRPATQSSHAIAVVLRSRDAQTWADALVSLSRRMEATPAELADVSQALGDTSALTRMRAAQAAGALGPLARPVVPQLVVLLSDRDQTVMAEAAFALGAVGERSERVLRALFAAAVAHDGDSSGSAQFAITALGRYPIVAISPQFAEELRLALQSPKPSIRGVALRTAMRTDVGWDRAEFTRLLTDADPGLRLDAAYALVGLGPQGRLAEPALRSLSTDSVDGIRQEVPALLQKLGQEVPKASAVDACAHRGVSHGPAVSAMAILATSESLRGDRAGSYVGGVSGMVVAQGTAFNFLLPHAPHDLGPAPDRTRAVADTSLRFLEIDLTHPVRGSVSTAIQPVRDVAAQLHAFFMRGVHGTIWNLRDIPVGATIRSDRTELSFFIEGRYHFLQFGPWALGECGEGYAHGRLSGDGTTPVHISRVSEDEFQLLAPEGSIARLWEWANGQSPVDRGLYNFSFALHLFPAKDR